jgi:endo-1,4-beta-xylanase
MVKAFKYLFLFLIIIILLLAACDKDAGVTTEEEGPQSGEEDTAVEEEVSSPEEDITEIPSLKEFFKDDFLIGTAVEAAQLEIPAQRELILKLFSSITAENAMKPEEIQPIEGVFDFKDGDKIVEFGQENGIPVRGHTLIWHNQVPDWFFLEDGEEVSKEKLRERMKTHITEVMQHYKGQIYAWDVVNEPIDGDMPDGLLRNSWFNILGEEYIELAFRYAREADPDAKLFLNEYDTSNANKRTAIVNLVKRLQEKGVPIDGIGMQMHISLENPALEDFEKTLEEFSKLGLEIHITEMDVSVYEDKTGAAKYKTDEMLNEQGHRVKDLFAIIDKYKEHITSITFWGTTDEYTWLRYYFTSRKDWPLPFDEEGNPKPFFWGMVDPSKLSPRINKAKAIQGTAVIDGEEDDIWQSTEYFRNLTASESPGVKAKALWDKEYLYILLDVSDESPGEDDAVTIFINEKHEKSDALDGNDRVIEFTLDPNWENTEDAALTETDDGYIFEARIPFEYIEGSEGSVIGLDFQVKDGSQASVKWNDKDNIADGIPKYWGRLDFVTAPSGATAYYGTPVIDGVMDEEYSTGDLMTVEKFIQGIEDENNVFQGATAEARVLWDENALYVYIEVNDPVLSDVNITAYLQDSVEVFIDENNAKTPSYEQDDGQFRVSFKNRQTFGSSGSREGFESAAQVIEGGYAVEVKIPFLILAPEDGTVIGFDLQVNDDQGSGARDSISKWNDPTNNSWKSTAGFGVLILKSQE